MLLRAGTEVADLVRRAAPGVRFFVLWLAAWAAIFHTTLVMNVASAAIGETGDAALWVICHTQDGGDPITLHDPLIKKCPKCILGALGHALPPPQLNEFERLALATSIVHAPLSERVPPRDDAHQRPGARAPPLTA